MKKYIIFFAGMIIGGIIIFVLSTSFDHNGTTKTNNSDVDSDTIICIDGIEDYNSNDEPYTKTEEAGEIINEKSFKVFQVYSQIVALVHGKDEYGYYDGTVYMLKNNEMDFYTKKVSPFYDDQIINVPKGKVVRLFGTYHYYTNNGYPKTVPVVRIVDK